MSNVNPAFNRLASLIGDKAAEALSNTRIHVFGLGGVGSWCAEALVRSGIGNISLVDFDTVDISNINRQVEATINTVGLNKTEALAARLAEINPDCKINPITRFFSLLEGNYNKTAEVFGITETDYIIDAIDTVNSKLDLIETAFKTKVTLYSSMGMARKLDPARLRTCDVFETRNCPLARSVREGLRKRGFFRNFTVVYSDEKPLTNKAAASSGKAAAAASDMLPTRQLTGSAVHVTAAAGMILASLVIRDVCGKSLNG